MTNKKEVEEKAVEWFINNRNMFKNLSSKVENILLEILDLRRIPYHITTSRTKEVESFKKKISKDKYDDPINQITDLSGIRIITYVEEEIKRISEIIEQTFDIDVGKSFDTSKELGVDKVGYKSIHFIGKLKEDRIALPEYTVYKDMFFEIQVRTILQHAWAEIEHDRNYKFSGKLSDEMTRRFKLLAGSLEMADREFNNISLEIDKISKEIEVGTKEGKLNFQINSTSLKQYLETKLDPIISAGIKYDHSDDSELLKEIDAYGLNTLDELDAIFPQDFISVVTESESKVGAFITNYGIIRAILIINDTDKYFQNSYLGGWKPWSQTRNFEDVFKKYGIDWDYIENTYNVPFA